MSRAHVIEEATFDVSFDAARAARLQEGLLPGFIRDRLLPLADEIFCGFSGDDTFLKLDSLELDLGDIPYAGFENEIERRFKAQLAAALDARKHALAKLPAAPKEADASSGFAQLRDFLETGVLEAGALQSGIASIDQLLGASIRNDSAALVRFLKTTPHRAVVARRLARQFHHLHVATIIDLLVAGDGKRLNQMVNRFAADLRSDARHAQPEGGLSAEIWEGALAGYLAAGDNAPEAGQLFHELVRQVLARRLAGSTQAAQTSEAGAAPGLSGAGGPASQDPNIPVQTTGGSDVGVIGETTVKAAGMTANEAQRPATPPAEDSPVAAEAHLQTVVRRLQGQPGPGIGQLIEEMMKAAPASLERLFQQWRSGAIPLRLESMDGGETRRLVRAFLEVRHGTTDGPFIHAIESQAARARSTTHYYRHVLEQLLREQNVDLDAAAAMQPPELVTLHIGPADSRPETVQAAATPDTAPPSRFSTLLERALTEGRVDELAQAWEESYLQHAGLIRQSFMRHAHEEGAIDRIAASFPEFILQDLAATVGQLTQQASTFMAALPRHPALRRELNRERNSSYWAHALHYLRTQAGRQFNQADYLRGLLQQFPEIDTEARSHSPVPEEVTDLGAVHDRLPAEAQAARISATRQGGDGEQDKAASRRELPGALVNVPPALEAAQADADNAQRMWESHGADFDEAIASPIPPSSATRQGARDEQATAATPAVRLRKALPGAPAGSSPPTEAMQAYADIVQHLQQGHGAGLGEAIAVLMQAAPASLASLLRQWQAGEIRAEVDVLGDLEARQLLHAAVRLNSGPSGAELIQAIDARATRMPDAAHLYRQLLQRFLQKRHPATSTVFAGHLSSSSVAMHADEAARPIVRRLQGPASGPGNISSLVDATLRDSPATLARLFQQWSSGEIEAHAGHLDADEARSLLHAYTEICQDGWVVELLQTAEMNAGHTGNAAAHYRDLLHGAILAAGAKHGNVRATRDTYTDATAQMEKENAAASPIGESAAAEGQYERLVQRLQGQQGVPLAGLIEQMRQDAPSTLRRIFARLQTGDIPNDMAVLDAAETLQLLLAYLHLQPGADDALLRNVEARAAQSADAAEHHRGLLKQLLHKAASGATGHAAPTGEGAPSAARARWPGRRAAVPHGAARGDAAGPVSSEVKLEPQTPPDAEDPGSPSHISIRRVPELARAPDESAKEPEASGQATKPKAESSRTVAHASMEGTSPTGANRRMDAAIWPVAQRLRALSQLNIAEMVKVMQHALPDGAMALHTLYRQLQSGEIRWQVGHLDGGEAHQLLRAFILLQLQAGASDFLQAIESHAAQAHDAAQYYRFLLARLLREENLDLEAAATVTSSTSLTDGPLLEGDSTLATDPWHGHGGSPVGKLLQQLMQRLQGLQGDDLAQALETTPWHLPGNAAILGRMFDQLRLRLRQSRQDDEPALDIDHLSAQEARQLLRASMRIHTRAEVSQGGNEEGSDLFDAIDAGAAQAIDAARYYRYLLKQSITHGLAPGPARGLFQTDVHASATPRAASAAEKNTDAKHDFMTSHETPVPQGQPGFPPASKRAPARQADKAADILIANAGMVLAAPYLPHLFGMLELTDASKFKNATAAERAAHLSQFAVNARCDMPEFQLTLNKLLCGIALETPIVREIQPLAGETQAVEGMLRAMIQHWSIIGNTSIEGLRESFLQRNGILRWREDGWRLKVETKAIDVLVDRLPWSIAIIKSPWMDLPIHVEWR